MTLAIQGFRTKKRFQIHSDNSDEQNICQVDIKSVRFKNKLFEKGKCYRYKEKINKRSKIDVILGITRFCSDKVAQCVLVIPFEQTFLGEMFKEETIREHKFDFLSHMRVHDTTVYAPLTFFRKEALPSIPTWVYEPETRGNWNSFAYYKSARKIKVQKRQNKARVLDLFAGCGGMSLGFEKAGLSIAKAVELDRSAVETYAASHERVSIFPGDVNEFLKKCKEDEEYRKQIGIIHHVHASPPCQGFSTANRNGGTNDNANNELSLCFVNAVDIVRPLVASFENVEGMWRRDKIHYLVEILCGLLALGYQVRCTCLNASDYGDAQRRPRIIVFAARECCELPCIPPKTHGVSSAAEVTVRDVLQGWEGHFEERDEDFTEEDNNERLQADKVAPAIRGRSQLPIHYSENRRISIEEAAALQSFPRNMTFYGTPAERRRQIGNAVPLELATAIARSIQVSLLYEYAEEKGNCD